MKKKIYRSRNDKKLAGVCAGFAEYFGIDATIVRLLFAFFVLWAGTGVLAYIVCALVIPEAPENNSGDGYTPYTDVNG
ncbi:MAG: PspC domain-containing protein [Clostridia bacterium]|nr:PspC domain-containing protein [Clostridia bacterium]MBR3975974.1 PspC domain-containing protein [Clostridia bacterium]